ncbi:MAG TPA: SLC13 family permease [Bauldia sp.]|nr:SLC13 family permease [Bauldia sp.]
MTFEQVLSVAVIALVMAALVWGRVRYDLVAVGALLLGLAVGIVPLEAAFSGFSNDIVIIVGSALLVSAGIARSGITEIAIKRFAPNVSGVKAQLALLVIVVGVMSAFVKNIGALAIMIPIAFRFADQSRVSASVFLMPMAFASLLGGLTTLVGTSPNIVVAGIREELTGTPFGMFDFAPVGLAVAGVGGVFLVFFYWLVPERRRESGDMHEALDIKNYLAEAKVTPDSTILGKTVADLFNLAKGSVAVTAILRGNVRLAPLPDATLKEGDIMLIEGDHAALDGLVAQARLNLTGDRPVPEGESIDAVEAVIGGGSSLIGWSAQSLGLFDRLHVNLLAISRKGQRLTGRPGSIPLELGDVIIVQGDRKALPELLRNLGCLPLAERPIRLGSVRRGIVPVLILATAVIATATGMVPVAVAFFAAAAAMVLFGVVPVREVYGALDGPILVMLAALIPVSESLQGTGATDVIAGVLAGAGTALPPYGSIALILVTAMAVTPFLNNAATVLVMAPIAATFATSLGLRPEAFLMAVAIGAGCDFLTPIGHQCNTLVMGPGGYRFGDYPRLGLPLSLLVIVVAVPMLLVVWPP